MFYEKNIIQKNPMKADIRFASVYPNIYRTAMSSLGYQIIYNLINDREDSYCERVIYPNTRSLETNSPLKDFDIISFTLQYEQDYFNVLKILKDSEIAINREDRTGKDPLIIAGGPCASSNPLPLSNFIDIFIIGEGEVILNKFLDKYKEIAKTQKIKESLKSFLKIKGIYIPKFNNKTKLAIVKDMDNIYNITKPIITETDDKELQPVFSNSLLLNVSRACTRGCRFCMSSYLYRPMREAKIEKLIKIAESSRNETNLNKVSLIGAAVSDYSYIDQLIESLKEKGFEISTPSMRIESINSKTIANLKNSGLKTLTIAPESIYPLRKAINKDIPDEKISEVINYALDLNLNIKLYFLIGLPGEGKKDIEDLANYMKTIDSMKYDKNNKIKGTVKFSVNPVIPKPHTPLQWQTYDLKDIKSKIKYLKKELKGKDIKFDSAKMGLIQYILSCGNEDIGKLLEKSLNQKITTKEWKENIPHYDLEEELPWNIIDINLNPNFLKEEYKKIAKKEQTYWCINNGCYNCGAC